MIELRRQHPAWGGRKLKRRLEDLNLEQPQAWIDVPARSTINSALKRAGLIDPAASLAHLNRCVDSNARRPMSCGRWTTRATSPPLLAAAIR